MLLHSVLSFQLELPLTFFVTAGLVVMNYLSYSLSGNVFIFPSFLKDSFAGYGILGWQGFFLSLLWIYHSTNSWSARFLQRNPLIILCGFLCSDKLLFTCCFQNYLLVFDFKHFGYITSQRNLWVDLAWVPLSFLYLDVYIFSKILEFFSCFFL